MDINGNVVATELTNADGQFWFIGLDPGTYSVQENPIPDGFVLTTLPNQRTFSLLEGQHLVYEDGAAMLPDNTGEFETNLGDELRWGNVAVPAPTTFLLMGLGLVGIGYRRHRSKIAA